MTAYLSSRHCTRCNTAECCDGTGMLIAREVHGFGPVYECTHCDRKPAPVKETQ